MQTQTTTLVKIETNIERELAKEYILETNHHLFLTGRAGSGKTTLLQEVLTETDKSMVVVAPTGVAAINAGGVTIHSFFQLPPSTFLPTNEVVLNDRLTNRPILKEHLKMNKDKRRLIRELDTLVIDEISMVRADLLDAIDFTLRFVRGSTRPFGGVQIVMVGDLYQLPPVVIDREWDVLRQYYASPYFFNAQVWQQAKMIPIELKKVYRQKDGGFLTMLNNIRDGKLGQEDLDLLNTRYFPDEQDDHNAILLTTHNRKADRVNKEELEAIKNPKLVFKAAIKGKFKEGNYPCDEELVLKKGAKVMFIRNDKEGRYYNGKLAEVIHYDSEEEALKVKFQDDGEICWVNKTTWENIRFKPGEEESSVEQEVMGSFTQFPFRLAWAVTVHKSQGLTLEAVCLDLEGSFAAGQAYVALSRCTTLEGLVMRSKIGKEHIIIDQRIRRFYQGFPAPELIRSKLEPAKKEYALYRLKRAFKLYKPISLFEKWIQYIDRSSFSEKIEYVQLAESAHNAVLNLQATTNDFNRHLEQWIVESLNNPDRIEYIISRSDKAIKYFTDTLFSQVIEPLHKHIGDIQSLSRVKKYLGLAVDAYDSVWKKINMLYDLKIEGELIYSGSEKHQAADLPEWKTARLQTKKKKGATYDITLAFFKEGMSIKAIAEKRSLAESTIAGHLTKWLQKGDIQINELMSQDRIDELEPAILKVKDDAEGWKDIMAKVGLGMTYPELRWMMYLINGE